MASFLWAVVGLCVLAALSASDAQPRVGKVDGPLTYFFSTGTDQIVAGKNNQGWWSNTLANNNPLNDNYAVGWELGDVPGPTNNYFTFDISAIGNGCALGTSAVLTIPSGGVGFGRPFLNYVLHDVSTDRSSSTHPADRTSPAADLQRSRYGQVLRDVCVADWPLPRRNSALELRRAASDQPGA